MKKTIWIAYDFGLKGDHMGLYKWLDKNNAEERGYGLALIKKITTSYDSISPTDKDKNFVETIKNSIEETTEIKPGDRIYMIWKGIEDNKLKGKFLFGSKRAAPWTGFTMNEADFTDTEVDG